MSNLVVQTNVLALNSHRNLKVVGNKQATASSRLSSGYRINSAADDAAGLAISEKMRAQIRGLDMASKNTQDGISLVQTAEGGMQEIDNMIQRIRELVVQSANDTNDYSTNDRKKLQDEIEQLTQGIDNMSNQVEFNAKKLLNGDLLDSRTKSDLILDVTGKLTAAIGNATSEISNGGGSLGAIFNANSADLASASAVTATAQAANAAYNSAATDSNSVATVATTVTHAPSVQSVAGLQQADFGGGVAGGVQLDAYIAKVDEYLSGLAVQKAFGANVDAAIQKANEAKQAALDLFSGNILVDAQKKTITALGNGSGSALWFQTGANSAQGMSVGVGRINTDVLGIGDGSGTSTIAGNLKDGRVVSAFIDVVENALQYVTAQRAKLGAVQNRLDYTKSSLDISSENLSASESRIRDADMAKEMMRLTAANVLQQAGVSMLAQANQAPQSVLQLLR